MSEITNDDGSLKDGWEYKKATSELVELIDGKWVTTYYNEFDFPVKTKECLTKLKP